MPAQSTNLPPATLQDIALQWQYAEQSFDEGNRATAIVAQIRCALLHSTLVTQQNGALENDEWQQAMVYTHLMPYITHKGKPDTRAATHPLVTETLAFLQNWRPTNYESRRLTFLTEMVPYLDSEEQASLIDYLIAIAPTTTWYSLTALLRVSAASFTPAHIARLFTIIIQTPLKFEYIQASIALAPHLPAEWVSQLWQVVQPATVQHIIIGISKIACYLPEAQWHDAFATMLSIPDTYKRALMLGETTFRLTPHECETVWQNALQMQHLPSQIFLLHHLIPALSDMQRQELAQQILRLDSPELLIQLSKKLEPWLPDTWVKQALKTVDRLALYPRVEALAILGAQSRGELQQRVWQAGVDGAMTEAEPKDRIEALSMLVGYLEGDFRTEMFTRILAEIRALTPDERDYPLIELSWVVREAEFALILEELSYIQPSSTQAHIISQIAYLLPDACLAEGMAFVRTHKAQMWFGYESEMLGRRLAAWAKNDPDAAYAEWKATLHTFADLPRIALLTFLANMLPFALAFTELKSASAAADIYRAVRDICRHDAPSIV